MSYSLLPDLPGIYLFLDKKKKILYVGKAKSLKKRVASYFGQRSFYGQMTEVLVSKISSISYTVVASEIEALLLEANQIKKHMPLYNIRWTDGKAHPFIRITTNAEVPAVLQARKVDDEKSIYFGPYPNVGDMRLVLRTLRRMFQFQSVINHPKHHCLYYHLELCPCVSVDGSKETKDAYKKNIKRIITFLQGNAHKVIKELEKERDVFSKLEDFEHAAHTQKTITAITRITQPITKPFEYEVNPNLIADRRKMEIDSLRSVLQKAGTSVRKLHRIECYDIANIQGKHATGSLVVFTNGEKDSSQYRKFKVYNVLGPNDVAMMEHVLVRRFKHSEWPAPDLLIVDGGKAQVSAAARALAKSSKAIPYIGLAKRKEIIVTPDFQEVKLPKEEKALHLIMRIRDEAHRFATTYHKKLRSKSLFSQVSS